MSLYETLTLLVLTLTTVVSFVSLVRTRQLGEQQKQLRQKQEELTELQIQLLRREVEDQKRREQGQAQPTAPPADVRVSLEGIGGDTRFVVTNWGYGPARNVDFKIRKREGRSSPLVKGDYDTRGCQIGRASCRERV